MAADKNEADITIAYSPSGKYVHYDYQHNPQRKTITLLIDGVSKQYTLRQLLPVGKRLNRLTIDGKTSPLTQETVRNNQYVVVKNIPGGKHAIVLSYK
ncbi:hypothetical protein GJR95_23885 [Spirosoma endbachense]|uniref:Uncharacterized protein n=1 Tax=Spirosoma endbachense TaxID=2666025 RepID=A0A6P1VZW5_9BACT|nr:hypothetical protein GJR95_23885 [Spirosoma endbachense]